MKHPDSEDARRWATHLHEATGHTYDDRPYAFHLEMVVAAARVFLDLIPEPDREAILAACWCHDLIEDCRVSWGDIRTRCGEVVAELVYAVTQEKGRTRADRANARYYAGIRSIPGATFVKLCDRLANVQHSQVTGGRKLEMYRREQAHFEAELNTGEYAPLWEALRAALA